MSGVIADSYVIGGGGSAATLLSEMMADGPLALWKQDETSGTSMLDSSGNGRHLTYNGANYTLGGAAVTSGATASTALLTTGRSAAAPSASWMDFGTAWSVEQFVKPTSVSGTPILMGRYATAGSAPGWYLGVAGSDAKMAFKIRTVGATSSVVITDPTAMTVGTKYHFVAVYSAGTMTLYRNGSQVATSAISSANFNPGAAPLQYGDIDSLGGFGFGGNVNMGAIYGTALSSARVAAHWAIS